MRTTAATLSILLSGVLLCGSAWAGLATDGNAYVDSEGFVWHGSTDFIGEGLDEGLTATVEWCVYYGPDDYPGTDYVPDADEFVYAYQVFVAADSAQITKFYSKEHLLGRMILAVVNSPPRQIADVMSEVLVLGVVLNDTDVVLIQPDRDVPLGTRIA